MSERLLDQIEAFCRKKMEKEERVYGKRTLIKEPAVTYLNREADNIKVEIKGTKFHISAEPNNDQVCTIWAYDQLEGWRWRTTTGNLYNVKYWLGFYP